MDRPVDIARLERGQVSVAHCFLPAWEAGAHESISSPSSIGLSFTTQLGSTVEDNGKARRKDVVSGQLQLFGPTPVSWLRVSKPSELIEITASLALRRSVATELGVEPSVDLAELAVAADPVAWAVAARFRSVLRGHAAITDVEHDTLVRLLYGRVFQRVFGGAHRTRGDGALDGARLVRTTEYIEANLGSDLSLGQISDIAALSPFHFLRSFRQAMGVTPHRYVTMRRMERARQNLLAGMSVAQVALAAEYSSQSWFAAAFREHFGFVISDLPVRGEQRWQLRSSRSPNRLA